MAEANKEAVKAGKPATGHKASYTIFNAKTRTPFIQQPYGTKKEVNERLAQLKAKFGKQYDLVAGELDAQGNFTELTDE